MEFWGECPAAGHRLRPLLRAWWGYSCRHEFVNRWHHQHCLSSSTKQETSGESSPPQAGPGLSLTSLPEPQSLPGGPFSGATGTANRMPSGLSVGSLCSLAIGGASGSGTPQPWAVDTAPTRCLLGEGGVQGPASGEGAAEGTGSGGLSGPEVSRLGAGVWGPTRCLCEDCTLGVGWRRHLVRV